MSRLLGIVAIYAVMVLACGGIGLFMLISPARVGNLVNESFLLFPQVHPGDWGKKLFLRIVGVGLLAFAVRFVLRIFELRIS